MLFIAICKERAEEGMARARVLCYDILCLVEENLGVALLASIARLWPAVLSCNHGTPKNNNLVFLTFFSFSFFL
jgi:hypothetical protein